MVYRRRVWSCRLTQEVPPYNFHGSLDDSLQNLRKVVPVAPRRDYVKYMDNIGKVLRYEAQLVVSFVWSLTLLLGLQLTAYNTVCSELCECIRANLLFIS